MASHRISINEQRLTVFPTECAESKECAPAKHHYDECVERVTKQIDDNGKADEDCVEECKLINPSPETTNIGSPIAGDASADVPHSLPPRPLRHPMRRPQALRPAQVNRPHENPRPPPHTVRVRIEDGCNVVDLSDNCIRDTIREPPHICTAFLASAHPDMYYDPRFIFFPDSNQKRAVVAYDRCKDVCACHVASPGLRKCRPNWENYHRLEHL